MTEEDKEYWNQLFSTYKESATLFEKNLLYITSGALGISLTFLSDIVDLNNALFFYLIIIAWSIFTLVILVSLISHYFSMKSLNHEMEYFLKKEKPLNKYDKCVKGMNISMIICLPLGLVFLILFLSLNLSNMSKQSNPNPHPTPHPTHPSPGTKGIEIPQRPQTPQTPQSPSPATNPSPTSK
jgi:hypothetical protein